MSSHFCAAALFLPIQTRISASGLNMKKSGNNKPKSVEQDSKYTERNFQNHTQRLPCFVADSCFNIEYKKLKNLLKRCPHKHNSEDSATTPYTPCADCEQQFSTEIIRQVFEAAASFTSSSKGLLRPGIGCGIERLLWRPRHLFHDYKPRLMEESRSLIIYAARNALVLRKLLNKYDKLQNKEGKENLILKLQNKRVDFLKSPWLIELCALYVNSANSRDRRSLNGFSCNFNLSEMNEPSIACALHESFKLEFNLSCPICLDTAFEPIALGCGHIFCNRCACGNASVPTMAGLKAADRRTKCPICRQTGVYSSFVRLKQSSIMLQKRCEQYWKERLRVERAERVKEAKEHWNQQSRLFLGY